MGLNITTLKPEAPGPVANTNTKLLIYGLFQKGRVLAQDEVFRNELPDQTANGASPPCMIILDSSDKPIQMDMMAEVLRSQ